MQTIDEHTRLLLITRAWCGSFRKYGGCTYKYILPYSATYMICTLPLTTLGNKYDQLM
jgi:hypothetical protein